MISFRIRAVGGSCLGSVLGAIAGVIVGVYLGSYFAESTFSEGVQDAGPFLFNFVTHAFAAIVEFGMAAVAGGVIGAIVGAVLGTVVSTVTFPQKNEPAPTKVPPRPEKAVTEAFPSEPQDNLPRPPTADEQG